MSMINCPQCNNVISEQFDVCVYCGCPVTLETIDVTMCVYEIDSLLIELKETLNNKINDNQVYDCIVQAFNLLHSKMNFDFGVDKKSQDQYNKLLFIMLNALNCNADKLKSSTIIKYFDLIKIDKISEQGYSNCTALFNEIISKYYFKKMWYPIYRILENAPKTNRRYIKILLDFPDAFNIPKIESINNLANEYFKNNGDMCGQGRL